MRGLLSYISIIKHNSFFVIGPKVDFRIGLATVIVADLSALREQYGTEIAPAIEYQSFANVVAKTCPLREYHSL
ncbi:hypothetical protein BTTAP_90068 [Brochothrix thermosphacta]|nr:hypothetical protein [Brochothrix thermosphacta]SPP30612.1 hypothetical protein BTTAP_90068 [Brochothrix thermosphacta]